MTKILSRSGDSLADVYDVEGSIAGIDQLETRELGIVHEMGATVFSERLSGRIERLTSGAINQSTLFDVVATDLPVGAWRVLGVVVMSNNTARTTQAVLSLRAPTPSLEREIPIFTWDVTRDLDSRVRIVDNGGAAANQRQLLGTPIGAPSMGVGSGQPQDVSQLAFRGSTSAFGAGTNILTALVYIAFAEPGGLSSRGLPIPGW